MLQNCRYTLINKSTDIGTCDETWHHHADSFCEAVLYDTVSSLSPLQPETYNYDLIPCETQESIRKMDGNSAPGHDLVLPIVIKKTGRESSVHHAK